MGLDNGIMLRGKYLQSELKTPISDWHPHDTEICYWRKFWGFRNEVVTTFGQEYECTDIDLDISKLLIIIQILEKFMDREYFEENGDSIWSYEQNLINTIRNINNIRSVIEYMELHPEVECYFYDSY